MLRRLRGGFLLPRSAIKIKGNIQELEYRNEKDYLYVCQLIKKMRDAVEGQFPGSKFLVYAFPNSPLNPISEGCFKENGISFYKNETLRLKGEMFDPYDGHTNGAGNKVIANELAHIINSDQ